MEKSISCVCGGSSKLVKKVNYPFGRSSKKRTIIKYRCSSCGRERFPSKMSDKRR